MKLSRLLFLSAAGGALVLGACGDDDDDGGGDGGGSSSDTGAQTVSLSETEFKIDPATVTFDKPGPVTFEVSNDGQTVHALEVEGNGIKEETEDIPAGETATLEAELEEGTYELYCPVGNHKGQGMVGELTVGSASGGSTMGDDDSSDSSGY